MSSAAAAAAANSDSADRVKAEQMEQQLQAHFNSKFRNQRRNEQQQQRRREDRRRAQQEQRVAAASAASVVFSRISYLSNILPYLTSTLSEALVFARINSAAYETLREYAYEFWHKLVLNSSVQKPLFQKAEQLINGRKLVRTLAENDMQGPLHPYSSDHRMEVRHFEPLTEHELTTTPWWVLSGLQRGLVAASANKAAVREAEASGHSVPAWIRNLLMVAVQANTPHAALAILDGDSGACLNRSAAVSVRLTRWSEALTSWAPSAPKATVETKTQPLTPLVYALLTNRRFLAFDCLLGYVQTEQPQKLAEAVDFKCNGMTPLAWLCLQTLPEAMAAAVGAEYAQLTSKQKLELIQVLVERFGADFTSPLSNQNTALHVACAAGSEQVVDYFLRRAPELVHSTRSQNGCTPLHVACRNGHVDIIRLLVNRYGADVNAVDDGGRTPIMAAAAAHNVAAVAEMISFYHGDDASTATTATGTDGGNKKPRGVDISSVDKMGNTVLHVCALTKANSSQLQVQQLNVARMLLALPGEAGRKLLRVQNSKAQLPAALAQTDEMAKLLKP